MAQHYIKFYPTDWLGDPKLQSCSLAEQGLWMIMLCVMHNAEPYGHLVENGDPMTLDRLAKLARITQNSCKKFVKNLENVGVFSRNSDEIIFSRRMVADFIKHSEDKENGKKGGNPKLKGVNPPLNPGVNAIPDTRCQIPNSNKKETRATRAVSASRFDDFWKAWPNKVGKPSAEKSYAKVSNEHDAIMAGVERYLSSKPPDRPWLNPATFLNQRRWEDSPASVDARAPTDGKADWSSKMLREIERRLDSEQPTEQSTALNAPLELLSIDGKSWA
jgi:hypothetical protein